MNFSDERYVKLYTRDTPAWVTWEWQARALLPLLMRKLDRSGRLEWPSKLAAERAIAASVLLPAKVVEAGLRELAEFGTIEIGDGWLEMPNFVEGQEAVQSGAARQRASKDRKAAREQVTRADVGSRALTSSDSIPSDPIPTIPSDLTPPTPSRGVEPADQPANDLPGEESAGLLLATEAAHRRKPKPAPPDALVEHVLGEMQAACRALTGQPTAGPTDCPGNRKLIARCQAETRATPEQWTRVIRAQLASVRPKPEAHRYLALSTLCVPANFLRLLDAPASSSGTRALPWAPSNWTTEEQQP